MFARAYVRHELVEGVAPRWAGLSVYVMKNPVGGWIVFDGGYEILPLTEEIAAAVLVCYRKPDGTPSRPTGSELFEVVKNYHEAKRMPAEKKSGAVPKRKAVKKPGGRGWGRRRWGR